MKALELWLVRHGETDWNRERRTQGHSQNVLSALGVRQARRLAARLEAEVFSRVYCSDLRRAVQTAELLFPGRQLELDPRLREISRGVLEGKTEAELSTAERKLREEMIRDRLHFRPEGGENFRDVLARVKGWLADLPEQGRVLAVTHGGVIHTLLRVALGHAESWSSHFTIENTSVTELRFEGESSVVVRVNDHAHLEGSLDLRPTASH